MALLLRWSGSSHVRTGTSFVAGCVSAHRMVVTVAGIDVCYSILAARFSRVFEITLMCQTEIWVAFQLWSCYLRHLATCCQSEFQDSLRQKDLLQAVFEMDWIIEYCYEKLFRQYLRNFELNTSHSKLERGFRRFWLRSLGGGGKNINSFRDRPGWNRGFSDMKSCREGFVVPATRSIYLPIPDSFTLTAHHHNIID